MTCLHERVAVDYERELLFKGSGILEGRCLECGQVLLGQSGPSEDSPYERVLHDGCVIQRKAANE